jgi:hypothetical protein
MRSITALAMLAVGVAAGTVVSGCSRAEAFESFELGQHDKLIAEAPGCWSECRQMGAGRRLCTLKNGDCKAICSTVPECKPDGMHAIQVCVVMKGR